MKNKIAFFVALFIFVGIFAFTVTAGNPGSGDDPVVSLSYITDVLWPQIKNYVDSSSANTHKNPEMQYCDTFTVVNLNAGQKLIGGAGSEFIIRMGSASIIASEKGGISDVTGGLDLPNGTVAPSNHLLIVPVSDGRGFTINSAGIVMAKGEYRIE